jgi:hypothetical protein
VAAEASAGSITDLDSPPTHPRGGTHMYASAQAIDFLAITKNASFPNRKLPVVHPVFPDGNWIPESWRRRSMFVDLRQLRN